MTTQQFPVVDEQGPRRITIGAGTALKFGFFFALGATLFSILISAIAAIVALVLGLTMIPQLQHLFGG